jgi:hypothetical protein
MHFPQNISPFTLNVALPKMLMFSVMRCFFHIQPSNIAIIIIIPIKLNLAPYSQGEGYSGANWVRMCDRNIG